MSLFIDIKYLNQIGNKLTLLKRRVNISGIVAVQSVVIVRPRRIKLGVTSIVRRMIYTINVITVMPASTLVPFSKT